MHPSYAPQTWPSLPPALARLNARLPHLPFSIALAGALNLAAWPALRQLDWQGLRGRRFCVHLRDLGLKTYFSVGRSGFAVQFDPRADVTFRATSEDYLRLALRLEDPDTLFFNRRLVIEGDTELGLTVKNMLDSIELDTVLRHLPPGLDRLVHTLRRRIAAASGDGGPRGR